MCLCGRLPRLAPRTRVLILQHPRERRVAIGTARMAARCLEGATVVCGTDVEGHEAVTEALSDPERRAVLLWPGPDAVEVGSADLVGPLTLVVVDGTWSTARRMLHFNPRVAALPRLRIAPAQPSEYRIRREPRAECLSTIEALATALGAIEGDPAAYAAMLEPFRAMVDTQLDYERRVGKPRDKSRLKRRVRPVWSLPPALCDPTRVVLLAVESNAFPVDAKDRSPDRLVHLLAVRGDGGERFERVVTPPTPLSPSVERHTRLSREEILGGVAPAVALRDFRAWCRPDDAWVAWGTYVGDLLGEEGLTEAAQVVNLRPLAAQFLKASPSSMERLIARLGLSTTPLGRGRGGERLGALLAVYQRLLLPR